jgi:hypothetical protein
MFAYTFAMYDIFRFLGRPGWAHSALRALLVVDVERMELCSAKLSLSDMLK